MSNQTILEIRNKLKSLENAIQNVTTPDSSILSELSESLDYFQSRLVSDNTSQKIDSDETINIWSDGACSGNPGPGGWGTVIQAGEHYEELSGYSPKSTNNIMEMTGAIRGLEKTPVGAEVILTSDSQYVVKGMKEWIHGWKKRNWKKADGKPVLNQELWIYLDKLASERKIKWVWVKGHANHPQNERCDELARQAITEHK